MGIVRQRNWQEVGRLTTLFLYHIFSNSEIAWSEAWRASSSRPLHTFVGNSLLKTSDTIPGRTGSWHFPMGSIWSYLDERPLAK